MNCPYYQFKYHEFVSHEYKCKSNNRAIPPQYTKMYCTVSAPKSECPGFKACPYYKPGF